MTAREYLKLRARQGVRRGAGAHRSPPPAVALRLRHAELRLQRRGDVPEELRRDDVPV